jgi:hypothetical protein
VSWSTSEGRAASNAQCPQRLATCFLTANAFVRFFSNPAVIPGARAPGECLVLLTQLTKYRKHQFLGDKSLNPEQLAAALTQWNE